MVTTDTADNQAGRSDRPEGGDHAERSAAAQPAASAEPPKPDEPRRAEPTPPGRGNERALADPDDGGVVAPFPVLDEKSLGDVQRRWFRGDRRDPSQLPPCPPGCVYVFETVDGRYRRNSAPHHLRGTEQEWVEAKSVSVVDMRPREVRAILLVPSTTPATDFTVHVTYTCQVEDPGLAAAHRLVNLRRPLQAHLRKDPEMLEFQHRFDEDQIDEIRTEVLAYLMATYGKRPPRISGMRIELLDVEVRTPRGIRRHAVRIQEMMRDDHADRVSRATRRRRLQDVEDLTSTPSGAAAFAIDSGAMSPEKLAEHRLSDESTRNERLYDEFGKAIDSGALNREGGVRIDVVDAAAEQLTGRPARRFRADEMPAAIADRPEGRKRRREEAEPIDPPLYLADDEETDDA